MRVRLISLNAVVGDFSGNLQRAAEAILGAAAAGVELAVLPELCLVGYPPLDLALRQSFSEEAKQQLDTLQKLISKQAKRDNFAAIVGTLLRAPDSFAEPLLNAAVFLQGERREVRAKSLIPNYDIFDEKRYFASAFSIGGESPEPVSYLGEKIGILICEDSWHDFTAHGRKIYHHSPSKKLVEAGATMLVNISASPFATGKISRRRSMISRTARELSVPIHYVNLSGANDEIIFDGDAFSMAASGEVAAEKQQFNASSLDVGSPKKEFSKFEKIEEIHEAILCGIRDYACKNGFKSAVLGISGGIDSAVVAALAGRALGPQNVWGYILPSKFSSTHSIADAEALARAIGIHAANFPIKFLQSTFELALKPYFSGKERDVTEENLQSRLRGVSLMAMSNKFGHMLLATGNKSEFSVGYSTLYGDMCGALAPIGDLFKTDVYRLAEFINKDSVLIPRSSIEKPPSAELKPNQTDQDTLPEYPVLDRILHFVVEKEWNVPSTMDALRSEGLNVELGVVEDVFRKVFAAEFKRRQAPPILRLSEKAFGIGRRYPLSKRVSALT